MKRACIALVATVATLLGLDGVTHALRSGGPEKRHAGAFSVVTRAEAAPVSTWMDPPRDLRPQPAVMVAEPNEAKVFAAHMVVPPPKAAMAPARPDPDETVVARPPTRRAYTVRRRDMVRRSIRVRPIAFAHRRVGPAAPAVRVRQPAAKAMGGPLGDILRGLGLIHDRNG